MLEEWTKLITNNSFIPLKQLRKQTQDNIFESLVKVFIPSQTNAYKEPSTTMKVMVCWEASRQSKSKKGLYTALKVICILNTDLILDFGPTL